jgi:small-conductance mechanosensitive channel
MWQDLQTGLRTLVGILSVAPPWAASLILLVGATVFAWLCYAAVLGILRRLLRERRPYLWSVLEATKNPTRLGLLLAAFAITLPTAPLDAATKSVLDRLVALATICLFGWIAVTALQIVATLYLRRFRLDVEDNLLARKHVTQVRVLMGVADTIIILLTIGFALMTFDTVRQYGVSLFASAGIAGVIAGLAARPVLSNLFAGVQLAVTQPIRLEDAVTVENEYGWIEEITSTYVVIRLWDLRRLIVPLSYFIEKPFYSWTRQASANIGIVLLYLDYTAPIDLIRQKVTELTAKSADWNGVTANVQVTNARPDSIEVRVLASANSPAASSNLCSDLREKLIMFLQQEHPYALPRRRNETVGAPPPESQAASSTHDRSDLPAEPCCSGNRSTSILFGKQHCRQRAIRRQSKGAAVQRGRGE